MKEKPRRLPLGGTTTNPNEYLDAWETLAAPLCKRFGWTHLAFDPDFQFDTEDGTVAMSPRAVKQIADALAEVHSEREELNRLRRLLPTGTYTLNVAHEEELARMREALRAAEKQRDEAFEQRDKAKAQLKRTHAAIKLVAAERDAARLEAAHPSTWLLREGNKLVRKVAAVNRLLSQNGCDCECDHVIEDDHEEDCERCLACRINAALNGKENLTP